jgi:hypothetical protein
VDKQHGGSPETVATLPASNEDANWGVPPICSIVTSASGRRPILQRGSENYHARAILGDADGLPSSPVAVAK